MASGNSMLNEDRSLQTFQIQVERGLPGVFSSYPAVVQTELFMQLDANGFTYAKQADCWTEETHT